MPELLVHEDTVPRDNAKALADKIIEVSFQPGRLKQMSIRNYNNAKNYGDDILQQRRIDFYKNVLKIYC